MGIIAHVFRDHCGDRSNGGISSKYHEVEVVNDESPAAGRSTERPFVLLVLGEDGTIHARQALTEDGRRWDAALATYKHGGTYVASDDPRFDALVIKVLGRRLYGAIPLHDREYAEHPWSPEELKRYGLDE